MSNSTSSFPISALPVPPTRLVGRDRDCVAVTDLLRSEGARLVTVTGPGGVGKTHLSLEVAQRLAPAFAGGVVFVSLASIRDRDLVLASVANELGIREVPGQPVLSVLSDALAGRQLLIVLDNLEQVVSAATEISDLLVACPSVWLLATSRSPLRLRIEREYPLAPLELPVATDPRKVSQLLENPAVCLFVERAQAVRPSFALTDANASAVVEICQHLDGPPLAIELAAAMMRVLSPQAFLARVTNRLLLLTQGASDLPDRQRTLRDTIAWSHELLDPAEQRLFRQLAVFEGGFTMDAIEALAGSPATDIEATYNRTSLMAASMTTLDLVASLVTKSLLVRDDSTATVATDESEPRYWMLSTIREFAANELDKSGEADAVRQRHLDWYLSLAERIAPELTGLSQSQGFMRLDAERENFRSALATAQDHFPEAGLRLAVALWRYWATRGYMSEGHGWLTRLLETESDVEPAIRASALNSLGNLLVDLGDYPAAYDRYEQALSIWQALNDNRGTASALNGQGLVLWYRGEHAAARERHEKSLSLRRQSGDRQGEANSLTNLANAVSDDGDTALTMALHEQALAIRRDLGDRAGVGYSCLNLGYVARKRGLDAEARSLFDQSLDAFREVGDTLGVGYALQALGLTFHRMGDLGEANTFFVEAITLRLEMGDRRGVIETIEGIGSLAADQGQNEKAIRLLGAAEALRELIDAPLSADDLASHGAIVEHLSHSIGTQASERLQEQGRLLTLQDAAHEATSLAAQLVRSSSDLSLGLSLREIEVLRLVASGMTNAQTADKLFLSRRTVDAHLRRIYDKLDLASRAEAIRFALERGLV